MEVKPKLIIGLGNPDKKYEKTYHNAGFLFIDYLHECQAPLLCQGSSGQANVKRQTLKSDVFMNQSGNFVKKAFKKFSVKSGKIKPEELLIVHDDSDIELGKYKISFGRSSAGHKGVESIIKTLKTKNFWRLRIGIGKTPNVKNQTPRKKAIEFVLKTMTKRDQNFLKKVFEEITRENPSLILHKAPITII